MIRDLPITDTFTVPIEIATRKTSIVAKSDSGKSYALRRILECIVKSGFAIPGAHIDPLGVAYGVRYGPDGESAGLAVPIFGGSHGDMPITVGSGPKIARALIESRTIGILDLSALDDEEQYDFVRDFVRAVGSILSASRQPFWLGADEADLFAPESPSKAQVECQRAVRYYCRRVRNFGGGYTFATQSTSVIDKKVVGQSDLIIAMHITSPTDQKPVIEWLTPGIGADEAKRLTRLLSGFKKGDALFYSPSWLKNYWHECDPARPVVEVRQGHISRCETFDSSKTPEIGEVLETVGRGAAIDLEKLAESLQADVAETSDDAEELRAEIRRLQSLLDTLPIEQKTIEKIIEVPALSDADRAHLSLIEEAIRDLGRLTKDAHEAIAQKFGEVVTAIEARLPKSSDVSVLRGRRHSTIVIDESAAPPTKTRSMNVELRSGAIRMLEACAQFSDRGLTRGQLAALAKVKQGPTYSTYLSELRRMGLVDERGGRLYATDAGIAYLPKVPARPRTPDDILSRWRPEFRSGAVRMLDLIVASYPQTIGRPTLAARSGIHQGPTFSTYLSELKRAELVDERDGGLYAVVLDLVDA